MKDPVRAGEGPHQEVEVGDAPLDEGHAGVIQKVLDVLQPPGGEVVDDDDVVVLCQGVCKVRAKPAPPVTMERMKSLWRWRRLAVSEWCWVTRFRTP